MNHERDIRNVLESALQLTPSEREVLIEVLEDSLATDVEIRLSPEFLAEIKRRSLEVEQGLVAAIPWEVVKRKLDLKHGGDSEVADTPVIK